MAASAYLDLLKRPIFRRFWLGFTLSAMGGEFTHVALIWFVYQKTSSAEALGILMVCFTAPIVVGGLMAGWLLDRFDRRRVMVIDNLVRGVAMAFVPLLHLIGHLEVWHVYVVAGIHGFLMMISLAGTPTMILATVPPERLNTANALEMLGYTLAAVAAPPIAGLLIDIIGAPLLIIVDVVSYFLFAATLASIPSARQVEAKSDSAGKANFGLAAGARLMLGNPILLSTTVMFMLFNIGGGMLTVWLPVYIENILKSGPGFYGFLLGAKATGETITVLAIGMLGSRFSLGTGICVAQALAGCAIGLILLVPTAAGTLAGIVLFGMAGAPLTIWAQTLRMSIIPESLRGRTFALLRTIMQGGRPLGGALGGGLVPVMGVPLSILLSSALIGLPGILGMGIPELRRAGDASPVPQPAN